ncbi:hypothetical protein N5853_04825 [Bartonella sp. HY329]|uniref:hypothetical protein n=1 Tax=unclassified Bartonella TaxID=2645622 RepID=UPI0021C8B574|nr:MULTISPECIES: hypothetical protein [unclassified Bartonella]UXM95949.1 hypothetical protein N5853_04825 [Bartonella sp. HY329]UXN10274.1 hypothetical protein N5852_04835 [Bartonella sp. HY328]
MKKIIALFIFAILSLNSHRAMAENTSKGCPTDTEQAYKTVLQLKELGKFEDIMPCLKDKALLLKILGAAQNNDLDAIEIAGTAYIAGIEGTFKPNYLIGNEYFRRLKQETNGEVSNIEELDMVIQSTKYLVQQAEDDDKILYGTMQIEERLRWNECDEAMFDISANIITQTSKQTQDIEKLNKALSVCQTTAKSFEYNLRRPIYLTRLYQLLGDDKSAQEVHDAALLKNGIRISGDFLKTLGDKLFYRKKQDAQANYLAAAIAGNKKSICLLGYNYLYPDLAPKMLQNPQDYQEEYTKIIAWYDVGISKDESDCQEFRDSLVKLFDKNK